MWSTPSLPLDREININRYTERDYIYIYLNCNPTRMAHDSEDFVFSLEFKLL